MLGRIIRILLVVVGLVALIGVGGYFALKRDDIPYATLAATYESSASRYADLPGGVTMHYRDEGARGAPTLLLIHGYGDSLHEWESWVARLKDQYHLVSIDLPGHGLTRAPAGYQANIEAFRDLTHDFARAQGLSRYTVIGNSMGGNIAWEYALSYPEEVEALVLVDAAGWPVAGQDDGKEPPVFQLLRNPIAAPLLKNLDNSALIRQGVAASFGDKSKADEATVTRFIELSRAPGHRDILVQLSLKHRERALATPERLAALTMPVLVMTGEVDALIPAEYARKFHDAIAGSGYVEFPGVGHIPQTEAPDASAAALRSFLERVYAAPPAAPAQE